jgi:acetyl esterase/lipase
MEATSTLEPTKAREVIEEKNIRLFPQFGVAGHWPPVLFLHGSEDTQVPIQESEHLAENLKAVGVENELIVVEGQAHTFDYTSNAEEFGELFDRAAAFLVRNLQK